MQDSKKIQRRLGLVAIAAAALAAPVFISGAQAQTTDASKVAGKNGTKTPAAAACDAKSSAQNSQCVDYLRNSKSKDQMILGRDRVKKDQMILGKEKPKKVQ